MQTQQITQETKTTLKEELASDIQSLKDHKALDPAFKRKRLIIWFIRTLIAVALYVWFWHIDWVRTSLWVYIPLNLLSLIAVFGSEFLLRKRLRGLEQRIDNL